MVVQEFTPTFNPGARIKVIWVGGWGTNTVNRMIEEGLEGVDFVAVNTDAQSLAGSLAPKKINIGLNLTKWLGAGAIPEVGRKSAEENLEDIKSVLMDADMIFVTAGMGWGTGTGAAPVIAQMAREMGILTVGVVTKPFSFEGKRRFWYALEWLEKMKSSVDTLIVIPNDKIFNIIDKKTTFKQAFSMIDKILLLWVQGIADLIVRPGDINIDFADIKMIMTGAGTALLGIWYGEWDNRAVDAARRAIDNPLLEASLDGAKSIVFAVTGGDDLTPIEVQEASRIVEEIADPEAMIVWGMTFDESYHGEVKVTIIATGFPDIVQTSMITDVGMRKNTSNSFTERMWAAGFDNKFDSRGMTQQWGWSSRTSGGSDFVNRAMDDEWVQSQTVVEQNHQPKVEEDYETPAFLRKKLGS